MNDGPHVATRRGQSRILVGGCLFSAHEYSQLPRPIGVRSSGREGNILINLHNNYGLVIIKRPNGITFVLVLLIERSSAGFKFNFLGQLLYLSEMVMMMMKQF